ncbi:MAG: response regulator [Desulfobacterales bacterium]|uniref:Response regulator n=1 Tax=Candidatus Desulfatibia vada TaxID=2841696 RepID=A0A8J6NVB3_9BACT|nr:response regulator [Candidatus Desulfatibia vada]
MLLKYKHTIMAVDDEASILKAIQRLLRKENYQVLTASSAMEGIELLKKEKKPVSLIISDQRMPVMNGSQFLKKSKEIFPDAIRFLLTGYSDLNAIIAAVNEGGVHRYLTKPWNDEDLMLQVRQSLQQYELVLENRSLLLLTKKQNQELNQFNKHLETKVQERSQEIVEKNKQLTHMNKELEASLFKTVRAFAALIEMQVPELAGHGRRVSQMVRQIAQFSDLPENEVTHIEIAALLHDIGKLGLPLKLIEGKDNNGTPAEKSLLQKHPEDGQNIVRFIKNLDHVGLLIRSHHERFDGQGYPDGLREETIPLGSRIIAVADAYDKIVNLKINAKALTDDYLKNHKVTRDHLADGELLQQAALYHLKQFGFTRYDPDVVKMFLEYIKQKGMPARSEKEITIDELEPGMVLIQSLYSLKGRFLLPHNTVLTEEYIQKLNIMHQNDPIAEVIYVLEKQR